ncbi:DUF6807 family protein [Zavarzinella formosa]|uniref:DUF6807 family protein n=1 Tax=Zavarzinella formosa TaxID=360055 RepID=UPI000309DC11|nr:DUF6807 family protein [Zavarzinella formosa]
MKHRITLALLLAVAGWTVAQDKTAEITITGGKTDALHPVIKVPVPEAFAKFKGVEISGAETFGQKGPFPGQIVLVPSLHSGAKAAELIFTLPEVKAGATGTLTAKFSANAIAAKEAFAWKDADGEAPVLTYSEKDVLKYVRPKFDPAATPPKQSPIANPTIKVYHHLFDSTGKVQLTNGTEGQFPHHRGIYFGFNNISYDGKKADVWHCRTGESQQHAGFLSHTAGPVLGRHRVQVAWNGQDGKPFAEEHRELTVYPLEKGWLVEFESMVKTERPKVQLDGDPQHAGFHFRAAQDVEKNHKNETYFLRPDGKGELGKEKNWEKGKAMDHKNLAWNAMSFVDGDKRYTTLYLDHPANPKEARQSERTYGRIGTYFEYDLTPEAPLKIKYRLWVQEGELTGEQAKAISEAFVSGPTAVLK